LVTRKKIAFIYSPDYNQATGIVIYLQNIVRHFKAMDSAVQPELLFLYTSNSPIQELKDIQYPFAEYYQADRKLSIFKRGINRLLKISFGKVLFKKKINADFAFPAVDVDQLKDVKQLVMWKEDFQESYYPQYFSDEASQFVRKFFDTVNSDSKNILVLSSYSSGEDLKIFYPEIKNRVYYLRFVSLLPVLDDSKLTGLLKKFSVVHPYFIVSNQFWPHKNHTLVLKAALMLKNLGINEYQIIFTGKTVTPRNADYFPSLQNFIEQNNLDNKVIITDFLPRDEQLLLMKHSLAIIQPSLFEGWSTVIEDAKALNKYILASDLKVNKEQVQKNVSFFKVDDPNELSLFMKNVLSGNLITEQICYEKNISDFRASLIELFQLQ
jgi:glycosyltransferase involved in cell wall biosynthesis